MPRLFSFGGRGGRLGGVQQEQLKGEPSCLRHQAGTSCFDQQADAADWGVTVDYVYSAGLNRTTYTFEVDALAGGACGLPDTFVVR
jgi:hypothetical protein